MPAALFAAPSNSTAPTTTGTAIPGRTLGGTNGTWTENPSFSYQWQKNGTNIGGATTTSFVVPFTAVPTDQFRRVVTATSGTGSSSANGNSLTVPAYDSDAASYFSRVQSAGGAASFNLTSRDPAFTETYMKAVWNTFFVDLKDEGVWSRVNELSLFCGVANINGTKAKVKGSGTNELIGLTDADYISAGSGSTFTGGIRKATNTSSYIDPDISGFQSVGMSPTNGHMFTYLGSDDYSVSFISDFPSGAETLASRAEPKTFINNGSGLNEAATYNPVGKGLFGLLFASSGTQSHSYGSVRISPTPAPSFAPNNPVYYLRAKYTDGRGATSVRWGTCRFTLASFGSSLTDNQAWAYFQAIDRFLKRIKVVEQRPEVVFVGDSGTHSHNLDDAANTRFSRRVAVGLGMREINLGVLTARLLTPRGYVRPGKSWGPDTIKYNPSKVCISLGANDFDLNDADAITLNDFKSGFVVEFTTAYQTFIDELVAGGIPLEDIVVCNIAWNIRAPAANTLRRQKLDALNAAIKEMANNKGVIFADFFAATVDKPQEIGTDEIHANAAGNQTRANVILEAIAAGPNNPNPNPTLTLQSAISRKTHGTAGDFDLTLPVSGNAGVESRSGGASGVHSIIFTFSKPIATAPVSIQAGTAALSGSPVINGSTVRVNLTGVADRQKVTLRFANATASGGGSYTGNFSFRVLYGDVDGSGTANATDHTAVRQALGNPASASRIREDVDANGIIDSVDVVFAQRANGQTVAP